MRWEKRRGRCWRSRVGAFNSWFSSILLLHGQIGPNSDYEFRASAVSGPKRSYAFWQWNGSSFSPRIPGAAAKQSEVGCSCCHFIESFQRSLPFTECNFSKCSPVQSWFLRLALPALQSLRQSTSHLKAFCGLLTGPTVFLPHSLVGAVLIPAFGR